MVEYRVDGLVRGSDMWDLQNRCTGEMVRSKLISVDAGRDGRLGREVAIEISRFQEAMVA